MNRLNKCPLYGGFILAVISLVLEWVIKTASSPLHRYFLYHVDIPNSWAALNFLCNVFAILTSSIFTSIGLSDSTGYYIALFAQWFLIGCLLLALICKGVAARNR